MFNYYKFYCIIIIITFIIIYKYIFNYDKLQ